MNRPDRYRDVSAEFVSRMTGAFCLYAKAKHRNDLTARFALYESQVIAFERSSAGRRLAVMRERMPEE